MVSIVDSKTGQTYAPDHADYMRVKVEKLENRVRELTMALVDVQNRLTNLDGLPRQWPGDTYEPQKLPPDFFD